MAKLSYDYDKFTEKQGLKKILDNFAKNGLTVSEVRADNIQKRDLGYQTKVADITFDSGQRLQLKAKADGSIYKVSLNGKMLAIRDYLDLDKAMTEIISYIKTNEDAFKKTQDRNATRIAKVAITKLKPVNTTIEQQTEVAKAQLEIVKAQASEIQAKVVEKQAAVETLRAAVDTITAQIVAEKAKRDSLNKQIKTLSKQLGIVTESADDGSDDEPDTDPDDKLMATDDNGKKTDAIEEHGVDEATDQKDALERSGNGSPDSTIFSADGTTVPAPVKPDDIMGNATPPGTGTDEALDPAYRKIVDGNGPANATILSKDGVTEAAGGCDMTADGAKKTDDIVDKTVQESAGTCAADTTTAATCAADGKKEGDTVVEGCGKKGVTEDATAAGISEPDKGDIGTPGAIDPKTINSDGKTGDTVIENATAGGITEPDKKDMGTPGACDPATMNADGKTGDTIVEGATAAGITEGDNKDMGTPAALNPSIANADGKTGDTVIECADGMKDCPDCKKEGDTIIEACGKHGVKESAAGSVVGYDDATDKAIIKKDDGSISECGDAVAAVQKKEGDAVMESPLAEANMPDFGNVAMSPQGNLYTKQCGYNVLIERSPGSRDISVKLTQNGSKLATGVLSSKDGKLTISGGNQTGQIMLSDIVTLYNNKGDALKDYLATDRGKQENPAMVMESAEKMILESSDSELKSELGSLYDPVYSQKMKVRGMGGMNTMMGAGVSTNQTMPFFKQFAPKWDKAEHTRRAAAFKKLADDTQAEYSKTLDAAAMKTWGRKWEITDYKISGIGSDEFDSATKDNLRQLTKTMNDAKTLAAIHAWASKYSQSA